MIRTIIKKIMHSPPKSCGCDTPVHDTESSDARMMPPIDTEALMPAADVLMPAADALMPAADALMPAADALMPAADALMPAALVPAVAETEREEDAVVGGMGDTVVGDTVVGDADTVVEDAGGARADETNNIQLDVMDV